MIHHDKSRSIIQNHEKLVIAMKKKGPLLWKQPSCVFVS